MIRILLVDDHPLVRLGLRSVLQAEPDFSIAGETGDGFEVLALFENLNPDVLVLDIRLQTLSGIEVIRRLSGGSNKSCPAIIVLSIYANENVILEALKYGAMAYVVKEAAPEHLVEAIRSALAGRRYLSPPISEVLVESLIQKARTEIMNPYETLTTREREVLSLVVNGYSNNEIAAHLSLGKRTVETYRANIQRKLGIRNYIDLIRFAIRQGILIIDG